MGTVCGLALLSKFYAPAFVGLALILMLLAPRKRGVEQQAREFALSPKAWSAKPVLATVGLAGLLVWAGYFFHVGHLALHDGQLKLIYPHAVAAIRASSLSIDFDAPVPAPEFFAGLHELAVHNQLGHPSFLLGRVYRTAAPHTFFPVVIALKWPTITLLLAIAGIILFILDKPTLARGVRIEVATFGAFGLLALVLALSANLGIGDRHVLTSYPFLLMVVSAVWYWASRLATYKRTALSVLVVLAALNTADALRYAPGYLSYFNIFVPPARSYKLLTDSSLKVCWRYVTINSNTRTTLYTWHILGRWTRRCTASKRCRCPRGNASPARSWSARLCFLGSTFAIPPAIVGFCSTRQRHFWTTAYLFSMSHKLRTSPRESAWA